MPRGWLLPKPHVDSGRLSAALERLRLHGVHVQQVTAPGEIAAERFIVDQVARAERAFQGHVETRLRGRYDTAQLSVHEGAFFVPAAQPLARLAFYLLEPESDDGFVTGNIIDGGLAQGETFGVSGDRDAGAQGVSIGVSSEFKVQSAE
ncbi:MAG: hypothetical protein L0099_12180 [Acidobacteria bacterium]|nr:hypothetical protein [Acidobacteriota bacterium]